MKVQQQVGRLLAGVPSVVNTCKLLSCTPSRQQILIITHLHQFFGGRNITVVEFLRAGAHR